MRRTALLFCLFAAAACGSDSPTGNNKGNTDPPSVASVTLASSTASLVSGQTTQLAATLRDSANNVLTGRTITYTSGATAVATVDANGLVTAVAAGTAQITVASGSKSATATITVRPGGVVTNTGRVISAFDGKVVVTIPAGAVASTVPISVASVASPVAHARLAPGTAYDFGPNGTQFAVPVTIDIKYDPALLPSGTVQSRLRMHKLVGNAWTLVDGSTVSTATQTVTGQTSSFSTYAILELEPEVQPNPLPVLTSITPSTVQAGSSALTLRALGSGFIATSVIHWNGSARVTTFVSAGELTTTIAASDIAIAGNAQVTVVTPTPGGGTSAAREFTITPAPVPVVSATIWTGAEHSCALTVAGAAWCWGQNTYGQLGNNATEHAMTPVQVSGGIVFTSLSLGANHTCGLTPAKQVYCWGFNYDGLIGTVSPDRIPVPTLISTALQFNVIAAAGRHTCGIATNGNSYCWGSNSDGQLGNGGAGTSHASPQLVAGGRTFTAMTGGDAHTCALDASGAAFCWGLNENGILGDGTTTNRNTPTAVVGGMQFTAIDANLSGYARTCAITRTTGAVWCWGFELADEPMLVDMTPTLVPGGRQFTSFSVGDNVACGTVVGGGVYCTGNSTTGGMGTGTAQVSSKTPLLVQGSNQFVSVASGYRHTCAVDNSGIASCWGSGFTGTLGTTANSLVRTVPTAVSGSRTYIDVSSDRLQTCALATDGSPWCWGEVDRTFRLAKTIVPSSTPSAIPGGFTFTTLSTGEQSACATNAQAAARCWGTNSSGQLGNGTETAVPVLTPSLVAGGHQINRISAGSRHSCGISTLNIAYCWGLNVTGELGTGNTTMSNVPVAVGGSLQFKAISAGAIHSCGLTTSGAAYCWGGGGSGALGNGVFANRLLPTLVSGGHTFETISAGVAYTCAVTTAGAAFCWGNGLNGELGNGSADFSPVPSPVSGGLTFARVDAGADHTCGVTTSGAGYCWGRGYAGHLGNGNRVRALTPQLVSGGHVFSMISPGEMHTCGVTVTQNMLCWGLGGLLGNGSKDYFTSPVAVEGGLVFRTP